jgi:uncharacterized protein YdeI (BOF family)
MRHSRQLVAARSLVCSTAIALAPFVSATALVVTSRQAMATPSHELRQAQPTSKEQESNTKQSETSQQSTKAVAVDGTIVKSGSDFVLKDPSGTVYRLDTPEKAEPFEGKSVKVTGRLDADANLLHVESIETITA